MPEQERPCPACERPGSSCSCVLGDCPPWCEKPPGHGWEDEWRDGPVRQHVWHRHVAKYHTIAVEEWEQRTAAGTVRQRRVVLDVESPTEWDVATAEAGLDILSEAIAVAKTAVADVGEVH